VGGIVCGAGVSFAQVVCAAVSRAGIRRMVFEQPSRFAFALSV
jgi:hypothetical protein